MCGSELKAEQQSQQQKQKKKPSPAYKLVFIQEESVINVQAFFRSSIKIFYDKSNQTEWRLKNKSRHKIKHTFISFLV